jgi:hypothetical protein
MCIAVQRKSTLEYFASKIQEAINSYWNNPVEKGDGRLGRIGSTGLNVFFNVTVCGVNPEEIQNIINNTLNASMSFFSIDGIHNSHTQLNDELDASEFNVNELEESSYRTAAHEYGHVLGYYVNKGLEFLEPKNTKETIVLWEVILTHTEMTRKRHTL